MSRECEPASLADWRSYRDGALAVRTSLQMLVGFGTSAAEAHSSKQIIVQTPKSTDLRVVSLCLAL